MQSTKDKLIVGGLFISILLGLIPVGFNIAQNFGHVEIGLVALGFFVVILAGGLVALYVFDFLGQILKLVALLAALGIAEALPWIAIGFCVALGAALFHML